MSKARDLASGSFAEVDITGELNLSGSAGTSGQLLTSAGASTAPTWQDAASAGWEYISTTTISGSPTSVVWTGLDMGTYDYCLLLDTIGWQVDTAYFVLDFSTNNGSTYITKTTSNTGANYARGSGVTGSSGANSHFGMCSVSPSLHGLIFIENFSNGVAVKSELYEASSGSSQRGAMITLCSVNSVNAFKFYDYFASRAFDNTGSIELYRREKGIPT